MDGNVDGSGYYGMEPPTTHQYDVSVASDAAHRVGGWREDKVLLLFLLLLAPLPLPILLLLFLGGLVALVGTGVALRLLRVGHHVDEALQRRTQLPLLVLLQAEVQRFVDHHPQGVDHLGEEGQTAAACQPVLLYLAEK